MNLLCGAMGVIFTFSHSFEAAFICMLAAAACDFCDGLAARMLHAYSPIGKELDSLADCISFGLLPSFMLMMCMLPGGWWNYIPLCLAVASALRLAKFNVDERQTSDFLGLPTPASALFAGSLCCFITMGEVPFVESLGESVWFLPAVAIVLSLLLVSEIPMFGMKIGKGHKLLDAKRIVFLCLAVAAVAVTIILGRHWSLAVLLVFVSYIVENLILAVI